MKCMKNNQKSIFNDYSLYVKCPCQSCYNIITNCYFVVKHLSLKYGVYVFFSKPCTDLDIINIEVISDDMDYFYIKTSDGFCKTKEPLRVLDSFMKKLNKYDSEYLFFHGGGVAYNDEAYLFLGATTSGKTTLVGYLANTDFKYITDDCIPINKKDLQVCPHCTPLMLRYNGKKILESRGVKTDAFPKIQFGDGQRYTYTPEMLQKALVPIKKIFFIKLSCVEKIKKMTKKEALLELLSSTLLEYDIDSDYLKIMMRLSAIPCFFVHYSDMDFLKKAIYSESST